MPENINYRKAQCCANCKKKHFEQDEAFDVIICCPFHFDCAENYVCDQYE